MCVVVDRLEEAGTSKNEGNEAFKTGDNAGAAEKYRAGIKALADMSKSVPPPSVAETKECQDLTVSLQLNLAMAEIRNKNFRVGVACPLVEGLRLTEVLTSHVLLCVVFSRRPPSKPQTLSSRYGTHLFSASPPLHPRAP